MNKELKDKWVAALRSGAYEQATGSLRRESLNEPGVHVQHCCLAVLLAVSGRYRAPQIVIGGGSGHDYRLVEHLVGGDAVRFKLQGMNDQERKPFSEIADYIEANVPAE
jgi:hypothetical protein